MKSEDQTIKTRIGVEYENQKLLWIGDNIILTLERYCSTINHSCANYTQKNGLKKFIEEKEKGKKDAVKDF